MAINIYLPALFLLYQVGSSMAATDCFTQVGDTYSIPADRPQRVSAGIDCPDSEGALPCRLQTGGFLEESPTLNITTDSTAKVFDAVRQATNGTFDDPVVGSVANFSLSVEPGAIGYYAFTPTLFCYEGTLGDCIGGDIEPGTAIEACEPRTLDGPSSDGFSNFRGTGDFVATDEVSVLNMTTNPADSKPQIGLASIVRPALRNSIAGFVVGAAVLWHLY
ncbi:MAG: hypothetical protein Q9216_002984 [Gyalolechia sp. 2 TL-2023]